MRRAHAGAAIVAAVLIPAAAPAQQGARPQASLRADAILARATAVQLGVGYELPMGVYVRSGLTVAAGTTHVPGGDPRPSGRVDAVGRFLLDPFREFRWGPYGGAGVSALWDGRVAGRERWRGVVVLVLGVEGPATGTVRSSVELGLGGGTRVGVVLRRGGGDQR